MNIVQPSIYGNDNSCTLDALRSLGSHCASAIVQFDPDLTSPDQLKEWHALGVRGVRLNYRSLGARLSGADLRDAMVKYSAAISNLNWTIQLYISLEDVPLLEPIVPRLRSGIKVCIDHFGHPAPEALRKATTPYDLPGFTSLAKLLAQGRTWVKLSATYRLHRDPGSPIVEALCRELLRLNADRCLFATDWPHTRYEGLETCKYIEPVLNWIEAEGISLKSVLVDNADAMLC
jgi:predicted TIM-barrel fold metal-dependent hydrolase